MRRPAFMHFVPRRRIRDIRVDRYHIGLIVLFLLVWTWAAIKPLDRPAWVLENLLVVIFVPLFLVLGRYFQLSKFSYTQITLFFILHVIGSHYTYAEVPFGFNLQEWFGSSRNMYDRLVHFSFGFLFAYPVREVFVRLVRVRGFWGYYLPLDLVLALSGGYEIIEWLVAMIVDPGAGLAFLGVQGDVWDAQKDMLAAAIGAMITMIVIASNNARRHPGFWNELRSSFRLRRYDRPLDELVPEEPEYEPYHRR